VDGVSLVKNYRSQFTRIIHESSYSELVQRLRDRAVGEKRRAGGRPRKEVTEDVISAPTGFTGLLIACLILTDLWCRSTCTCRSLLCQRAPEQLAPNPRISKQEPSILRIDLPENEVIFKARAEASVRGTL
jgi:hypothetical protein